MFILVEKIQILRQLTLLHQQKKESQTSATSPTDITNWHQQPTSSFSSTASDWNSDEESHNDRFKIITENERFKWKLPKSMANYANKYFEEYALEDSLKEDILCQNPAPDNLDNVRKLDNFLRDILNEKRKTYKKISKMFWKSFIEKLLMWWVLCRKL